MGMLWVKTLLANQIVGFLKKQYLIKCGKVYFYMQIIIEVL